MNCFDTRKTRKQTLQSQKTQPEFLLLSSEPAEADYLPGRHLGIHYQNRYLAKRQVMRSIRRMKRTSL